MLQYVIAALGCWMRHAGHDYGDWECDMGPNGYSLQYRVCRRCDWVQMPSRTSEG